MLKPVIHITIGDIKFFGAISFEVTKDVDNLSAKGKVELPLRAFMRDMGRKQAVLVSDELEQGQYVMIEAGYDGYDFNVVFEGFVTNVDTSSKVVVTVEDYLYLLRRQPVVINEKNIKVGDLCNKIIQGISGVTVSDATIDATVDSFTFSGNAAAALAKLKEGMHLTAYFDGSELYVGGEQLNAKSTINITYGVNVLKNDLSYQYAKTNPVQVIMIGKKESGEEVRIVEGMEGGSQMTFYKYNVTDEALLRQSALDELARYSFDGFKGTLGLSFMPYAEPGGAVVYRNKNYKQEVDGSYFIKGVKYSFTTSEGLKQSVTLGAKI